MSLWDWLSGKPTYVSRFDALTRKHVVLHLVGDYSLDGVLAGLYADGVQLDAAKFIRVEEYDTALDGSQIVPWKSIIWIQELSDGAGPANA